MKKQTAKGWQKSLSNDTLLCRDTALHHAWTMTTAHRIKGGFERVFSCPRCKTTKYQELDLSGTILRTRMKYPEGYLKPKGSGRSTAADNAGLRAEIMRRLVK